MAFGMSYGGIFVDGFLAYMCISVACLYRERQNLLSPTNGTNSVIMMFVLWITFHVFNFLLFDIGVFPMMMLSCLCLFFDTKKRSSGKRADIRISLSRSCRLFIILYFLVRSVRARSARISITLLKYYEYYRITHSYHYTLNYHSLVSLTDVVEHKRSHTDTTDRWILLLSERSRNNDTI